MTKLFWISTFSILLWGCNAENKSTKNTDLPEQKSVIDLKNELNRFEDSIKKITQYNPEINAIYAKKCIELYKADFKNPDAVRYLDKAHIIYSNAGNHLMAIELGEEIIKDYPNYKNRMMVLQSLATTYDIYLKPRNVEKIKQYYNLMLDVPSITEDERKTIQNRLNNINLSFEEMVELQNK